MIADLVSKKKCHSVAQAPSLRSQERHSRAFLHALRVFRFRGPLTPSFPFWDTYTTHPQIAFFCCCSAGMAQLLRIPVIQELVGPVSGPTKKKAFGAWGALFSLGTLSRTWWGKHPAQCIIPCLTAFQAHPALRAIRGQAARTALIPDVPHKGCATPQCYASGVGFSQHGLASVRAS